MSTEVALNNIITVFQGHAVCVSHLNRAELGNPTCLSVCLHGLSPTEKSGPSSTAHIDIPLINALHQEVLLGMADSVGVLANYVENNDWNSEGLMEVFDTNVTHILMFLKTHLRWVAHESFLEEILNLPGSWQGLS